MNNFEKKTENPVKIEAIQGPNKNEVALSPERGGIITSMILNKTEVLHLNRDNFNDREKNVRGGIPILYPNAGPLENDDIYKLKQHGYARTSEKWELVEGDIDTLTEVLKSDDETKKGYPFDTTLKITTKTEEDGSVTINQEATNTEKDKEAPISMGLHPYFKVKNEDKEKIKFDFEGGKEIESDFDNWSEGGTTMIDNPKLQDPEAILRVEIPGLGTIVMDISQEYKKIWIWTMPGEDFVCVEPVMRNPNGLVDDPEMVKPGEKVSGKVNYRLE